MRQGAANGERGERLRRGIACAVAVLANLFFLVALDRLMPVQRYAHLHYAPPDESVLLVRLIESPPVAPVEPESVEPAPPPIVAQTVPPLSPRRTQPRVAPAAPPPAAPATPTSAPSTAAPTLQLFDADGRVRLSDSPPPAQPGTKAFPLRPGAGDSAALEHANPLPYQPTMFGSLFPSDKETLGGEIVRKSTVSHAWRTPWGGQFSCSFSPLVLTGFGCGWGYPPHMSADGLRAMRVELPPLRYPIPPAAPQADSPKP